MLRKIPAVSAMLACACWAWAAGPRTHVEMGQRAWDNHIVPEANVLPGLAEFRADDELMRAFYSGCTFPDFAQDGINNDAAEYTHWYPFQKAYFDYLLVRLPPPWSEDAKREIAFFFGIVCHGVGDVPWHFDEGGHKSLMTVAKEQDGNRSLDLMSEIVSHPLFTVRPRLPGRFWWPCDSIMQVFGREQVARDGITLTVDELTRGCGVQEAEWKKGATFGPIAYPLFQAKYPWTRQHMADYYYGGIDHGAALSAMCIGYYYARLNGWHFYQNIPVQGSGFPKGRPFLPCSDATIREREPMNNTGADPFLEVAGGPGDERRALIRFDVSDVPASQKIRDAVLWLHFAGRRDETLGSEGTLEVFKVNRPWNAGAGREDEVAGCRGRPAEDGEASWRYAAGARAPWGKEGCDAVPDDRDGEAILGTGTQPTDPNGQWWALDVSAAVQYWVANPSRNFGVLIKGSNPGAHDSAVLQFDSSDALKARADGYGGTRVTYHPILVVR